jgi:hypothetical protein
MFASEEMRSLNITSAEVSRTLLQVVHGWGWQQILPLLKDIEQPERLLTLVWEFADSIAAPPPDAGSFEAR